ncbi:NADP-dependent oxidoreductase [Streptomyces syringium]|uniref:NADP-dependent oxidoreductase n=1 Tax=Streptomyces syringium TaxID=76729 RepID=UPI003AAD7D3D
MGVLMRAVRQLAFGGPEELRVSEVERPEPVATEVLVRVEAAGVNPVDAKFRAGVVPWGSLPFIPGWDVSGVVEAVTPGVTRFAPGDEVYGMVHFPWRGGGYAEYVTAPPRHLARKPAALTHAEAAALPMAALTAWQGLVDTARVSSGQRVLILGAAGGTGHLAVQIAKALGAYVIGTARAEKHAFVRGFGADDVVDYTTTDVAAAVRDVDVLFDLVAGDDAARAVEVLRPGGILVSATRAAAVPGLAERGVRFAALGVEPDYASLEKLNALIEQGRLRVHVERSLPLTEAAEAHHLIESGRVKGKIVLVPQEARRA